jgi:hypothetical protein
MEDDHDRTALFGANRGEVHRQSHGNDYRGAPRLADLDATIVGLQACFAAHRIPSSGPEWRCAGAVIPGVKSASINCAEYFSPATIGSGPISAMRFPWVDLHFSSAMVINHTLPNDSTTVPRGPCLLVLRRALDTRRDARTLVDW